MIEKKTLINYSSVRELFKDSIRYGFNHFLSRINYDKTCGLTINHTELNNKLIQMHLDDEVSAEEAIEKMDNEIFRLLNSETNIDWEDIFVLVGRNNVFNIFCNLNDLSDEDYWKILGYCYTTSDFGFADSEIIKSMFLAERQHREFLMNEEEREYLNSLPDILQVYRGCSIDEINSGKFRFSWTLDKQIAEFFAYEYQKNKDIKCSVVSKTIKKSSVIAYFNDRNEKEIFYIG